MPKRKSSACEPIVESLAIAVPAESAWEALTTPRHLSFIVLGHAEMEPKPGKSFLWEWKVWAEAAPGKHDAKAFVWRGTVLDAVPGSTLVLGGKGESMAVLTVKGQGGSSLVTVTQADAPPGVDLDEYRVGWADFLLKLKTRLEGPPASDSIYLRCLMRAKPAELLKTWVNASAMSKILPGKVKAATQPGQRFEWLWKEPKGKKSAGVLLDILPRHRLAFTWEGDGRPAEIRLSAEQTPYGALVSLEHRTGARSVNAAEQTREWARLLERLRAYFWYGKKIRTG